MNTCFAYVRNATKTLFLAILHSTLFFQMCAACCSPEKCCTISGCVGPCQSWPYWGKTFLLPRSQGTDSARDSVGSARFMHRCDSKQAFYNSIAITPQYMSSFNDNHIAEYFFGTDCLHIAGSKVEGRSDDAIMADYFGLSPSFESTVKLNPTVKNFVTDIELYGQYKRLWWTLHAPITWTQSNFKMCEEICNPTEYDLYPEKYMSTDELAAPLTSFACALQCGDIYGDVQEKLCYGHTGCKISKKGVADIHLNLGYDIWLYEYAHAGFYANAVIPTGTRSHAQYLLEPIIGNGRHGELGLGFNGEIRVWECDETHELSFYFDGKVNHLFKSRQCRSFDLCQNCPLSRYMLLKTFKDGAYTRKLIPAINITTLPCDISIAAQLDIVALVRYLNRGFEFDVGYNAWLRTEEKLKLCGGIEPETYGLKGIQNVIYNSGDPSGITQHCATLHGNELTEANQTNLADNPSPRYISTSDLDICSGTTPRSLTHKLFMYCGYAWNNLNENRIKPFLGLGTSVEFEGVYPDWRRPNENTISQYSIWLKAGTTF